MKPVKIDDEIVLRLFLFCILAIFIFSAINKVMNFNSTAQLIRNQIPFTKNYSKLLTLCTIITMLVLPILILIDPTDSIITQISAITLILFMILIIIFFHNPFTMKDQSINAIVRLSIIGGLLLILYIAQ